MASSLPTRRKLLDDCDLETLFIEHLGWDHHKAKIAVLVGDHAFALQGLAEKRSFAAFVCEPRPDGKIPDIAIRAQIDRYVAQQVREHLIIYVNSARTEQIWQWVRRAPGQPIRRREFAWRRGQPGGVLLERALPSISFTLEEEERITLPDVAFKAAAAFDVEKVTKRFFERFQAEHTAFHKFVDGITDKADRDWYASVMLNRLMFCYFIQKKGLLDGDHDYLRNRMSLLKKSKGKDQFWSFYRHFLLRLFHEGLSLKPAQRKKDLDTLIGRIPYLNGGLFLPHDLEEKYKANIEIPDEAFERIFRFFDEFQWHLDERPLRENNEINPDVLGYIFEKYINQKQMGAYYTKEDITGYISQNTIIPFILDQAARNCAVAFRPPEGQHAAGSVWRLLKSDPDRYIYSAVRQGVIDPSGAVIPLPKEIAAGVKDVAKRGGWNKPASEPFALPTETWREHVGRRDRCLELRSSLAEGDVTAVNNLVTLNLDIRQFAEDIIDNCEGPELLRAIWKAVESVTVLDPTCGSGAFLFAALNILEPLYEACLDRMGWFVDSLAREAAAGSKLHPEKFSDFKKVLARVEDHPNRRYFILKSIIVNNLFGVDIMEEACEICKLRLFLKLVAQVEEGAIEKIEPLPDIDFNIRAGNTLVGFTSTAAIEKAAPTFLTSVGFVDAIKERAEQAATAFSLFRDMQTKQGVGSEELAEGKTLVRGKLNALHQELDRYLASEYEVNPDKPKPFAEWRKSHEPFHWFVDFYAIMAKGGFDVIIGNPPYVRSSKIKDQYSVKGFKCDGCPDIYAWVVERSLSLLAPSGRTGMIVPLSLTFSDDFARLRQALYSDLATNWFSSFGRIPSALFSFDVRVRNTIHLGHKEQRPAERNSTNWASRLHRWFEVERSSLFPLLSYSGFEPKSWKGRIPKLGHAALVQLFEQMAQRPLPAVASDLSVRDTPHRLHFKKTAYNWLTFSSQLPPCFGPGGEEIEHTKFGDISFQNADTMHAARLLLNGKIMLAYWIAVGDDFDVTRWMFADMPIRPAWIVERLGTRVERLSNDLQAVMVSAVSFKLNAGKRVGNYNLARCRDLTDKTDRLILEILGVEDSADSLDLLYSQVVRTSFADEQIEEDE